MRRLCTGAWMVVIGWLFSVQPAKGVLFYEDVATDHNAAAPTGFFENSGWQYEGYFGGFLATMISPFHILTSKHGGTSSTFIYDTVFSGVETVTYNVDASVNEGLGYWDIPGTDMRIFQLEGGNPLPTYAPLYTKSQELNKSFIVIGRGGVRGDPVYLAPDGLKGWKTSGSDGVARWGRNTIDSILNVRDVGDLLVADFDAALGVDEAHISVGDSGGAIFVNDNGVWKLAGINYGVEGYWDDDNIVGDGQEFAAALFDKGGFYKGSDATGWTNVANNSTNRPSELYMSRVSTSSGYINSLVETTLPAIPVPEPGGALLLCVGGFTALLTYRRGHRRE